MRMALSMALLAAVSWAHGESARSQPPPTTGPQVFPTGGPTTTPRDSRGTPRSGLRTGEGWESWWAYNLEYILARRLRGVPVSGTVRIPANDRITRERLRKERLFELMLEALEDKSHYVQASAAIALGKFGDPAANDRLDRHIDFPGEGWFDVREASIYAMGVLGLTENRRTMRIIAKDKERSLKERSLALVSFAMDESEDSAFLLKGYLQAQRSSVRVRAEAMPTNAEEEQKRLAAHLFGYVEGGGYDELLYRAASGSRHWGPGVQGLAITALGRRKARDYIPQLFRLMARRDVDDVVKQSIPIALGMMLNRKDEGDIRRLARFVRDHRRGNVVQHFTVMALADIGGEQVAEILARLHRDNVFADDRDRAFLWLAMGRIAVFSEDLQQLLLEEYRRARTPHARSALALALALGRVSAAIPITIKYLEKSSVGSGGGAPPDRGRGPAARRPELSGEKVPRFLAYGTLALGLHGDPKGVATVRKILKKYHVPDVRQSAAMALALLLRQKAVPELVDLLERTGTVYTKAAVVTAFGLLPEPTEEAVRALVDAYRNDSFPDSVRAMAVIALGALADPRPVPLSVQLTHNYNYLIRCLALDEIASFL